MTAEAETVSPAELSLLPTATLSATQLGDLELLLSGALAPLTGFMTQADVTAVADRWQLADGTPFPAAVTLDLPSDALPDRAMPASGCCSPIRRERRSPCSPSGSEPSSGHPLLTAAPRRAWSGWLAR